MKVWRKKMLNNFLKFSILSFCCMLIFTFEINAQIEAVKQKRSFEHQAIKDFLQNKLLNSPVSTNNSNSSELKYSLQNYLNKTTGDDDRKSLFMNGNNIAVEIGEMHLIFSSFVL